MCTLLSLFCVVGGVVNSPGTYTLQILDTVNSTVIDFELPSGVFRYEYVPVIAA